MKCHHCKGSGRAQGPDMEGNEVESNCLYCEGTGIAGVGNGGKPKSQEDYWKEECRKLQEENKKLRAQINPTGITVEMMQKDIDLYQKAYLSLESYCLNLQQELMNDEALIYWVTDDVMCTLGEDSRDRMEKRLVEMKSIILAAKEKKSIIIQQIRNDLMSVVMAKLPHPLNQTMHQELVTYFTFKTL